MRVSSSVPKVSCQYGRKFLTLRNICEEFVRLFPCLSHFYNICDRVIRRILESAVVYLVSCWRKLLRVSHASNVTFIIEHLTLKSDVGKSGHYLS
jgi:hypothetical protein